MEYITDTLGRVLEAQVARHPAREFIVYPDRGLRFTYAEFDRRVNALAKGLLARRPAEGRPPRHLGDQRARLAHPTLCHGEDRGRGGHGEHGPKPARPPA